LESRKTLVLTALVYCWEEVRPPLMRDFCPDLTPTLQQLLQRDAGLSYRPLQLLQGIQRGFARRPDHEGTVIDGSIE
jgi:hypothetical protein